MTATMLVLDTVTTTIRTLTLGTLVFCKTCCYGIALIIYNAHNCAVSYKLQYLLLQAGALASNGGSNGPLTAVQYFNQGVTHQVLLTYFIVVL
jgi:hypothetical protein